MVSSKVEVPSCCWCWNVKLGTYFLSGLVLGSGVFTIVVASMFLAGALEQTDFVQFDFQNIHSVGRTAQWLSLGTGLCLVIIASMAVYGVVKRKGTYLIPMFLMQIFSLLCALVYMTTVMCKWPIVKQYLRECPNMPEEWKEWVKNLDDVWLILLVFGIFFINLVIKIYFISVVYRCYKHLLRQALSSKRDPEISCVTDVKPIYKLPKYEDVQKVPLVADVEAIDVKPPPYCYEEKLIIQ